MSTYLNGAMLARETARSWRRVGRRYPNDEIWVRHCEQEAKLAFGRAHWWLSRERLRKGSTHVR